MSKKNLHCCLEVIEKESSAPLQSPAKNGLQRNWKRTASQLGNWKQSQCWKRTALPCTNWNSY